MSLKLVRFFSNNVRSNKPNSSNRLLRAPRQSLSLTTCGVCSRGGMCIMVVLPALTRAGNSSISSSSSLIVLRRGLNQGQVIIAVMLPTLSSLRHVIRQRAALSHSMDSSPHNILRISTATYHGNVHSPLLQLKSPHSDDLPRSTWLSTSVLQRKYRTAALRHDTQQTLRTRYLARWVIEGVTLGT